MGSAGTLKIEQGGSLSIMVFHELCCTDCFRMHSKRQRTSRSHDGVRIRQREAELAKKDDPWELYMLEKQATLLHKMRVIPPKILSELTQWAQEETNRANGPRNGPMTVVFSELARHYSYPGDRTAKRINGFPVVLKDLRNFLRSQLYLGPADVALLTFYKSGQGGPRHADDEEGKQGLDLREPITVISLGSPRVVRFTNFQGARTRVDLLTTPGSVYVMKDPLFQKSLKHQLLQGRGGRFSISFRTSKPQEMGRYKEESRDRLASESVRGGRSSPARDMNLEVQKPDAEAVAARLLLEKEREKVAALMKENRALVKELTNEKRKQSECQVQKMMMEATSSEQRREMYRLKEKNKELIQAEKKNTINERKKKEIVTNNLEMIEEEMKRELEKLIDKIENSRKERKMNE